MSCILVAYASTHGQTRKIAELIAAQLRLAGHEVDLADAAVELPPVEDYDAVVVGSRVQFGAHARPIVDYIRDNRDELAAIPSYFFSVSMSAVSAAADPEGYLEKLFTITGWRPRAAIAFAGGLPYRSYNFLLRFVMKRINRHHGGDAADTSRDHEYTDWSAVGRFAADIARDLAPLEADEQRPDIAADNAIRHARRTIALPR
ncbi:MAG: protoporphyrinogen oxidase [Deltaproteobacteria bacterium]|nr:MAG: protoporphyrinogen oxidase [Deltaproteobacteria bacterium]